MMIDIILRKLILIITPSLTLILNLSRLNPKDTLSPLPGVSLAAVGFSFPTIDARSSPIFQISEETIATSM